MAAECFRCEGDCNHAGCVKRIPVFASLSQSELEEISLLINRKDFSDKDVVFREGDKLNALYLVRYGNLKLVRSGAEGEEIIVNLLSTGDFYGGDSLFSESTARETGICSGECGVCSISSAELKKLIIKIPNIALKMLTYFSSNADHNRKLLKISSYTSALKRTALFLLDLSERNGSTSLEISQEDIASSIFTAKETVNRKLAFLTKCGILAVTGHKKIEILDRKKLRNIEFLNEK
jgi:CRP/FNR family transcriptional regulator